MKNKEILNLMLRLEEKENELENLKKIEKEHEKINGELREEIKLKDLVINKIAEMLNSHDIDEDICMQVSNNPYCELYEDEKSCINCIKEYFYELALKDKGVK